MIYTSNLKVTRTLKDKNFTQVDNNAIEKLTPETLGIYIRLSTFNDSFTFNDINKKFNINKKQFSKAIFELKQHNLIVESEVI